MDKVAWWRWPDLDGRIEQGKTDHVASLKRCLHEEPLTDLF
jgi:hypothetical protein